MSQADAERFVADLTNDEGLRNELSGHASGVGSVVAFATGKGYDITPDDVATYLQGQTEHDLSDEQLDSIAGGKGHHHNSVTQVATAQTVAMATTEAIAVETTVNVGGEVEVAAVAVIVAT